MILLIAFSYLLGGVRLRRSLTFTLDINGYPQTYGGGGTSKEPFSFCYFRKYL